MKLKFGGELRNALAPIRSVVAPTIIVSAVINVLMLVGSFFMLLVYDEVLPSRSVPTLVGLLVIVAIAYFFLALLEMIRAQITGHLSAITAGRLSDRTLDIVARYELTAGPLPGGAQPVRDLDQVRSFMAGPGPLAFLDLPWVLLFLIVLFVFHWSLAALTLLGVLVLFSIMALTDRLTSQRTEAVSNNTSLRMRTAEDIRRNAGMLKAMGSARHHNVRWLQLEGESAKLHGDLTRFTSSMSAITKAVRLFLQSLVLALGAYLVIIGEATGGIIIAGSILAARALAPVEQVIGNWKGAVSASQALQRLEQMLNAVPANIEPAILPLPSQSLAVENLFSGPPGARKVTIGDVSFALKSGDGVAIIGRSGSGKSTLVKTICGIWPEMRGNVRLDGASLDQYGEAALSHTFGYVPQNVELMPGTIAENIARFDYEADMDDIIAAAKAADIHDFIVHLEGGYEHIIGPDGGSLSAGQTQRVALARALYGNPFILVLDEPNSNLDTQGEFALSKAVTAARERGAIVLMVAHRPTVLAYMSHVLIMNEGRVEQFGTTDNVQSGSKRLDEKKKQKK
ncbi:MAG: type I secretion system permease/ATPase [Pseudomonadota bacterium]